MRTTSGRIPVAILAQAQCCLSCPFHGQQGAAPDGWCGAARLAWAYPVAILGQAKCGLPWWWWGGWCVGGVGLVPMADLHANKKLFLLLYSACGLGCTPRATWQARQPAATGRWMFVHALVCIYMLATFCLYIPCLLAQHRLRLRGRPVLVIREHPLQHPKGCGCSLHGCGKTQVSVRVWDVSGRCRRRVYTSFLSWATPHM